VGRRILILVINTIDGPSLLIANVICKYTDTAPNGIINWAAPVVVLVASEAFVGAAPVE
jgi:hypothetical protein